MAIFKRIFSNRPIKNDDVYNNLICINPFLKWDILKELGDGSFGKVCFLSNILFKVLIFTNLLFFSLIFY